LIDKRKLTRKIIISVVILILLFLTIRSSLAIPVRMELAPPSIDVVLYVNKTHYVPVTIRNPSNETVYNIKFTNVSSYVLVPDPWQFLNPNESVTLNFRFFSANEMGETGFVTVLSFDYLLNISQQPITYPVYLDSSGFSITNLTVLEGDSVEFINNDSNYHTLTELPILPGSIDRNLSNQGDDYTLRPDKNYEFFDRNTGVLFHLYVVERDPSSFVHSSSLDSAMDIRMRSILSPVSLDLELITPTHTIAYNESGQGVVKLYNPSNATAYNVSLQADWIVFLEKWFDIPSKGLKVITYNITPKDINDTSQTNRSYFLPISAKGLNLEGLSYTNNTIEVYIPYANLSVLSTDKFIIYRTILSINETLTLCGVDPEYPGCDALIKEVEKIVIKVVEQNATVSVEDFKRITDKVEDMSNILERRENLQTQL